MPERQRHLQPVYRESAPEEQNVRELKTVGNPEGIIYLDEDESVESQSLWEAETLAAEALAASNRTEVSHVERVSRNVEALGADIEKTRVVSELTKYIYQLHKTIPVPVGTKVAIEKIRAELAEAA